MVRGDLGYSPYFNQSVWDAIKPKIDVTVTLAILGVLVAIVVSIPAGRPVRPVPRQLVRSGRARRQRSRNGGAGLLAPAS